ncbi:hypothetical protein DFS34DRAFT_638935 [Phlyctochytrium arcticum]|nr:hypothetical protein DFS34DRAFT_638935 [Phlyctochytrium arcticum]
MANGTFKGVKNRLRGSSLGNKYEPVARSLVDLDGGSPILERKTAGGIGSSSSHSSSRDVSGLSIHNIGSSQQLSRRAFSIELSDQGLVDSPQGSADISVEQKEKQDASPNLQVSSRLRRQRSIGAPLSRFANARGGGHRRTKSGSAVVMYGRSTGNIGATMDDDSDDSGVPSRTSLDSLSDCLDSKGWDEMEEKDRNLQQPNADPISFRTRQPSLKMGSYDGGNVVHRGLFAVEGYKNRAATLGSPRAPIPSSLPVTESACSSSLEFTPAPPLTHKPSAHVIDAPIEVHLLEAPPRQMTLLSTDSDSDADIFVVSEYPDSRRQTGYSAPASDQSLMSGPPSPSVTAPPGTQSARADNNRPLAMDIDSLTGMGGISALPSHAVTAIRITPPSPATPISLQMGESGHAPFIDPLEKRNIGGGGGDIDAALQIVSTISPGTPPTRSRATSFSAATSALFKNAPGILRTTTNSNTLPAVSSHIPPHSTSFSQPSSPHPTPPPAPSSKQPHFQGVLWKKDELNEKGMRAINRKWAQVWAVLYAEPPQLEFYRLGGKGGISDSRAAAAAAAAISASGDVEKSGNPIMFDPVTGQLIPGGRSSSIPTNSSSANNGESYESIRSKTWGARPSVGQRPLANTESTSIHGSDASTYIPASSQAASVTSIRSNNPDSEAPTTNPGAPTSSSNPLSKQASSRKGIWHSIATFGHGASSGSAIFGAAPQAPVTTPGGTWTAGSRSRSSSNAGRGGRTTNERPIGMGTNTSGSGSNTISNGNAYQSHESSGSGGLHSTDNDRPPSQVIPLSRPKAAALPATGYTKHKHVLRLYPVARRTILLRCPSEADKERWSRMIAEVAAMPGANSSLVDGLDMTSPEGSRTGTLVSPSLGFTPMTTIETLDRAKKSAGSIASVPQDGVMRSTRDLHQST